jgi:hypothetical protein
VYALWDMGQIQPSADAGDQQSLIRLQAEQFERAPGAEAVRGRMITL